MIVIEITVKATRKIDVERRQERQLQFAALNSGVLVCCCGWQFDDYCDLACRRITDENDDAVPSEYHCFPLRVITLSVLSRATVSELCSNIKDNDPG